METPKSCHTTIFKLPNVLVFKVLPPPLLLIPNLHIFKTHAPRKRNPHTAHLYHNLVTWLEIVYTMITVVSYAIPIIGSNQKHQPHYMFVYKWKIYKKENSSYLRIFWNATRLKYTRLSTLWTFLLSLYSVY